MTDADTNYDTNDQKDSASGTLIETTAEAGPDEPRWHHSVEFEPETGEHTTACGDVYVARYEVEQVHLDPSDPPADLNGENICYGCATADMEAGE